MIEIINYKGNSYPLFQSQGFASEFAIPFARKVCKGIGVDVGCNRVEWMYEPGVSTKNSCQNYDQWYLDAKLSGNVSNTFPIDPVINNFHAMKFPENCKDLDYVFSSHCLEHLPNWVEVLEYWTLALKRGGVLFLYLPDYSQVYWRPWNNKKHLNILIPDTIKDFLEDKGYRKIFTSSVDLNCSFMVMAEK